MEYNEQGLEILNEINNIASSNAATALSLFLNKDIEVLLSDLKIKPIEEICSSLGEEEEIFNSVMVQIDGSIMGNVLFVVKDSDFDTILWNIVSMYSMEIDNVDGSAELKDATFKEIGNILSNSYVSAIGKLLYLDEIRTSVPYSAKDMLSAIITSSYANAEIGEDYVIDMNCILKEDASVCGIGLYFIVSANSLEFLVERMDELIQ